MHPDLIAPEDKQCGALEWIGVVQYRCLVEMGHDGAHAAESSPGETVSWPNVGPKEGRCRRMGYVGGQPWLCLRKIGHPGSHVAHPGPGEVVAWPNADADPMPNLTGFVGPYGLKPDAPYDQQRQTSDYERREARRDAVELAVRALKSVAGLYRSTEEYGGEIIHLAAILGTHIRNGA